MNLLFEFRINLRISEPFWLRAEGFQGIPEAKNETFMGGFACCLLVVFLCSLLISGCGAGDHHDAKMKEHGTTCYGEAEVYEQARTDSSLAYGYQSKDCVCPTNNTCTWARDEVCDEIPPTLQRRNPNVTGVCAQGTDCEDCGTCNWYKCVKKEEVPKPPMPSLSRPQSNAEDDCCQNTCNFANDHVCQDGGTGSANSACGSGTDCDCLCGKGGGDGGGD